MAELNPASRRDGYSRLSVVVNNYNYARYLPDALDAALAQLHETDELIVVDDGSTDHSLTVLEDYRDRGVIVIGQENQGQLRAVRTGIEAASGDVIVLLDSDDCFLDGYLARLREIFRDHPQVAFTFTRPQVKGENTERVRNTQRIFHRMAFHPGEIGRSRWAALLFSEYVGVPTSGLSLRKSLAETILSLPPTTDETTRLGGITRRVFGIPDHEANVHGFSADGIIVRGASVLGAVKYYNDQPGFMYRVHGGNKYASVPTRGQWFMRTHRRRQMTELFCRYFSLERRPTCDELREEIRSRSWARHWRRRLRIRLEYCLAARHARGTLRQKLRVVKTALWTAA